MSMLSYGFHPSRSARNKERKPNKYRKIISSVIRILNKANCSDIRVASGGRPCTTLSQKALCSGDNIAALGRSGKITETKQMANTKTWRWEGGQVWRAVQVNGMIT